MDSNYKINFNFTFSIFVCLFVIIGGGCFKTNTDEGQVDESNIQQASRFKTEEIKVVHQDVEFYVRTKSLPDTKPNSGKTLVLLPSATFSTAPNWDLQFKDYSVTEYFAKLGWFVIAIDLPGYGKSANPPNPAEYGAAECTPYIKAAIDQLAQSHSIEKVNLIGWSWGAQVAGFYAMQHPQTIRRLVLYGFNHSDRMATEMLPKTDEREITFSNATSDFIPGCYDPKVPEQYANAVLNADGAAPSGAINDFVNRLPIVDPTKLEMPVLVICGQYELDQPPHIERDFSAMFRRRQTNLEKFCMQLKHGQNRIEVIKGGGHAVHLELPYQQWRDKVKSFLESDLNTGF